MNTHTKIILIAIVLVVVEGVPNTTRAQLVRVVTPRDKGGGSYDRLQFAGEELFAFGMYQTNSWKTGEWTEKFHLAKTGEYEDVIPGSERVGDGSYVFLQKKRWEEQVLLHRGTPGGKRVDSVPVLLPLHGELRKVGPACWSEDGRLLAIAVNQSYDHPLLFIMDAKTMKERTRLETSVTSMTFSKDGKTLLLATGRNHNAICLVDVSSGKTLATTKRFASQVGSIAITPDGHTIISTGYFGDKFGITFWGSTLKAGTADHIPLGQLLPHEQYAGEASEIAIWPDGKMMAFATRYAIHILDIESRTPICKLYGQKDVEKLAVSTDGEWLASSSNLEIALWRWKDVLRSAKPLRTIQSHRPGEFFPYLRFSPDGRTLAFTCAHQAQGDTGAVGGEGLAVAQAAADDVATGGISDAKLPLMILLIDPETGKLKGRLTSTAHRSLQLKPKARGLLESPGNVYTMEFSPDGKRLLATADDAYLLISWSLATKQIDHLVGLPAVGKDIDFSPGGKELVVSTSDSTFQIDLDADQWELNKQKQYDDYAESSAFTPDGKYFLRGTRQYKTENGVCLFEGSISYGEDYQGLTVSRDGQAAYAFYEGQVFRWVLDDGRIVFPYCLHSEDSGVIPTLDVALSPSGSTLATATTDHKIRLWDAESGRLIVTLIGHQAKVESIAFSPNGKLLASTGADGTIRFWDVQPFVKGGAPSAALAKEIALPVNRTYKATNGAVVKVIFGRPATNEEFKCAIEEVLEQIENTEK